VPGFTRADDLSCANDRLQRLQIVKGCVRRDACQRMRICADPFDDRLLDLSRLLRPTAAQQQEYGKSEQIYAFVRSVTNSSVCKR
jgi:hypothetical protein